MTGVSAINPRERAAALAECFSPRVVGEVNDVYVKIAKIKGDAIPWHNHPQEDELFRVLDGELLLDIECEEPFTLKPGDLCIVGRGVNHRVTSTGECSILPVENKTTAHLGEAEAEITRSVAQQLNGYDRVGRR
jgi:mannose-6-phosphate isomerase-like protein (cupin superfamily)